MNNQEQFESILHRYATSPFCEYIKHPKSVGLLSHFLYTYQYHHYDTVQYGSDGKVSFRGKVIADYSFCKTSGIPIFDFSEEVPEHVHQNQDIFLYVLTSNWNSDLYDSHIKGSDKDADWFYYRTFRDQELELKPVVVKTCNNDEEHIFRVFSTVAELIDFVDQVVKKQLDGFYLLPNFKGITKRGIEKFNSDYKMLGLNGDQWNLLLNDYITEE